MSIAIQTQKLRPEAKLPRYAHTGPWGDLAADLYSAEAAVISPGSTTLVPTGIAMAFPADYGALVEDRSGLAVKGITTLAGVIDPGYRGEIKVVLTNVSSAPITLAAGDRIAQLRIVQRLQADFVEVEKLDETTRGSGGFGSTGA
ncbi:dUTP diphosphatase [Terriglobus saanensis]|uniref:dUTP diphosphatase n=1 Tax=Terriglobus saanensis (strain ATCC BAA-1853 / DSM 23119 / SP1PR4) TaxID=401053 RepID=E8V1E2_TERSS|nr:dUTP diphosphatase [Terriglobus saanensis]ADV84557.1 deoxyuridine 5'-triphosphate nucleotidohydrolase Dut [Terriglobus saanensis SP1PR4]